MFSLGTHSTVKAQTLRAVGSEFHLQSRADPGLEQMQPGAHPHTVTSLFLCMSHVKTQIFLGPRSHETFRNVSAPSLCCVLYLCWLRGCSTVTSPSGRQNRAMEEAEEEGAVSQATASRWEQGPRCSPCPWWALGTAWTPPAAGEVSQGQMSHPECCGKGSAGCGWHLSPLLSPR